MKPDRSLVRVLLLLGTLAAPLRAQVGHDPARSPYRTLRYGQFIGATGGFFNGDGGQIGIAPHHGGTFGLRYDFLGERTLSLGFQVTYGDLERFIVDKDESFEAGHTGPVKQSLTSVEGIMQFSLTGGKTWHGIAPFVSAGMGLGIAGKVPADVSGFKFTTKFTLTPGIGARIFLGERMFLRLEARSMFWQVTYPASFRSPPTNDLNAPPLISGSGKEWITNGWYTVGLAYAFHRPF